MASSGAFIANTDGRPEEVAGARGNQTVTEVPFRSVTAGRATRTSRAAAHCRPKLWT
jgi:hypothetical protein